MFVSLRFKLELKKEDKEKLIKLMRKQSSAIRVAYNMLKELEKEKTKNPHAQIYHRLRQLFPELPTKYKDIAGAYVIGRKALGFKEDTPENYERRIKDKAYLEFVLKRYKEREEELTELIEKESNKYKRNALKSELKNVEYAHPLLTNLIQSLQSELSSCEGADGRNPERGRGKSASSVAWQVLRVAPLFPILGKVLPRDLFPLKPVLVEGAWDRVRNRLAPLEAGGRPDEGFFLKQPQL